MQHSHMAHSVPATVVSAGRVHLENGKVIAGGASSSLNVSSREEDSGIIQRILTGTMSSSRSDNLDVKPLCVCQPECL
jgi:hypothetical protein